MAPPPSRPARRREARLALAAALGLCWLPQTARAVCTVVGLSAVPNGALGTACQPYATLADGASCAITCHAGYTTSGTQPSCPLGSDNQFDQGSIVCTGQPCLVDPVIDGIASTATECEELPHASVCTYFCVDGLRPSGTTDCDAGAYGSSAAGTATCDEIDACVDFPCPLPVSETCADVLASNDPPGLNDAAGRTCTGNPCNAETASALAGNGYEAAVPTATTVSGLGNIGCASGFMRAGDRSVSPTASCPTNDAGQTPGTFQFAGCVASACSGIPAFLEGFDLTGETLPARPADSPVGGLNTCQANRLPSGTVALTASCDLNGDFQLDNAGANDLKVCAPCTVVSHVAVEACTYTIPSVPAVGTAPLSAEATTDLIELCAAVDISGTDAAVDENACTSAGSGSPCSYTAEAVYTCTTATDSRVSACKPGYFKTVGSPDVAATVNTVESTNDVCTPCVSVENSANGAITSCTTAYDTRVSGCAAEFYRSQGVTERCDGATQGDATDTACEALTLDGNAVTCTGASAPASPCSHTEGTPDTCIACGRVVDALDGMVQNCTMANDTRVESCKATYVLVRGAGGTSPVPDTCWSTPPSVAITYTGVYSSITATPAAFDSFKVGFKNKMSEFLTIPTRRIVVTAVVSGTRRMLQAAGGGSIVVYFYLLFAAPSAPLNEYSPTEAYTYLTSSAASGTLDIQFAGAGFSDVLVMPVDVPEGYQPPPPPPPPIVCAEVSERNGCLESGCAWEVNSGICWTIEEGLAEERRKTWLLVYLGVLVVMASVVLAVCFCYALKICCFKLKAEPMHVGVEVHQA